MDAEDTGSRSGYWMLGCSAGAVATTVAAGLLVQLIVVARRIGRQAGEIHDGLRDTAEATAGLGDVALVNDNLERIRHAVQPPAREPAHPGPGAQR